MECMCAQTRPRFILSSERVLGNGVRTYVNSKGKIRSIGKNSQRRIEPMTLHQAGQQAQHTNKLFQPQLENKQAHWFQTEVAQQEKQLFSHCFT